MEFVVVAWRIWKRRNEFICQKDFTYLNIILKQSSQRLQDLITLHQKAPTQHAISLSGSCVWEAPPKDIKINWDTPINHNS